MANSIDDALPRQRREVDSHIEGHVEADGWVGGNVSAEIEVGHFRGHDGSGRSRSR